METFYEVERHAQVCVLYRTATLGGAKKGKEMGWEDKILHAPGKSRWELGWSDRNERKGPIQRMWWEARTWD